MAARTTTAMPLGLSRGWSGFPPWRESLGLDTLARLTFLPQTSSPAFRTLALPALMAAFTGMILAETRARSKNRAEVAAVGGQTT